MVLSSGKATGADARGEEPCGGPTGERAYMELGISGGLTSWPSMAWEILGGCAASMDHAGSVSTGP